jgi:hypothetical protein
MEDEGRVLQVLHGISDKRSKEEMIFLGKTVQDRWQLTMLCIERESLWQNQRRHDLDLDRTFEFGSPCSDN